MARFDYAFEVPEELDPLGYFEPSIGVRNGLVVGISVNSRWVSRDFDYSLSGLLNKLGQPDEIWLRLNTDLPVEYEPEYEIDLFYPSIGILLNATGTAERRGDLLGICPQKFKRGIFPPALLLWSPMENVPHETLLSDVMGRKNDVNDFFLLEKLTTNFDHDDFYGTYLDPQTTTCFDATPTRRP